jgi:4-amino-4-deoxy-L-arabinose transferase-like glycosyltransferase
MQRLADRPGRALLLVIGTAALLDLFAIGERILIVGDEALYAAAAREMLERGDWIVPSFNYEPRYQKPALIYWLIGASYRAFGVSEAAARLPSALFGIALCAGVYEIGRRLGDRLTGLAAGLVMATSVATLGLSRAVMTDVMLCAFVTAAIAGFAFAERERAAGGAGRAWTLFAFAALGLGALTKGPVAWLIPALVWLPWLAWRGGLRRFLRRPLTLAGAALGLAIAAPWFVAVHLRTDGAFTRHAFGFETFERFFGEPVSSASLPWWGYAVAVWPAFLPWSACLPSACAALWRRARSASRRDGGEALAALAFWWAAVVFVFFSFSATRVVTYMFPAFPALALLVGRWWSLVFGSARPAGALSPRAPCAALLALSLALLALLAVPGPLTRELPSAIVGPLRVGAAALAAGSAAVGWLAWRRPAPQVFAALVGLWLLLGVAAAGWLMPRVEAFEATSAKAFGEWLRAHPQVRALALDDHAPAVCFYAQRRVERFRARERDRFREAFEREAPAAAVVRHKRLGALSGLGAVVLAEDHQHVYVANPAGYAAGGRRGLRRARGSRRTAGRRPRRPARRSPRASASTG